MNVLKKNHHADAIFNYLKDICDTPSEAVSILAITLLKVYDSTEDKGSISAFAKDIHDGLIECEKTKIEVQTEVMQ